MTTIKTALITGASRGLGLALARHLAIEGWQLIINARGAAALEIARAELAAHVNVLALAGDVADANHRRALAGAAGELGGLDLLVNNASILGPSPQPALLDYPLEVLEQVYRTNVIAPLGVVQAVRATLKPGARIINLSSDAAVGAYAGWGGYGSSKAALDQMSAILAAEQPDWRVYWVDPGDMNTQMHQEAFPGEDISDRPPPENSVPGMMRLVTGDLPSGRYQTYALITPASSVAIKEFRVALTVGDWERATRLYRDGLSLPVLNEWEQPTGRGMILDAGRATLELLDHAQTTTINQIEAGADTSHNVRFAVEVADVVAAGVVLVAAGAQQVKEPVHTPWGDYTMRLQDADGGQITLFQAAAAVEVL